MKNASRVSAVHIEGRGFSKMSVKKDRAQTCSSSGCSSSTVLLTAFNLPASLYLVVTFELVLNTSFEPNCV